MLSHLKSFAKHIKTTRWFARNGQLTTIPFAGYPFSLDEKWVHEREYIEYLSDGKITGPLGMDVWVFSQLVHQNDRVLDAGANIGFTPVLAALAGAQEIHCFEPDPRLESQLLANTVEHGSIQVHPMALGKIRGILELRLSQSHHQGSTFSETHQKLFPQVYEHSSTTAVEVVTVDDTFNRQTQFDLFKIDVEGAEFDVLLGAQSTLKHRPPRTVYVELYDEYHLRVDDFLNQYYRHCHRLVCRKDGCCKLFPVDADFQSMAENGLLMTPPSYIYTNESPKPFLQEWTQPLLNRTIFKPNSVS